MCFEEENEEEKYKKLYPAEIEVSDGWYSVRAVLDDVLSSHLRANKIRVGSKMFVQNCQLNGAPEGEGVQPLKSEAYKARLLLHSNSCRPCKWDAKLGLQKLELIDIFLQYIASVRLRLVTTKATLIQLCLLSSLEEKRVK
jgi:hypothetical protein